MPITDRTLFGRVSLWETQAPLLEIDRLRRAVGMPRLSVKMDAYLVRPAWGLRDRIPPWNDISQSEPMLDAQI